MGEIVGLYRYPVKGLTPEPLDSVELKPGETLPFDRASFDVVYAHGVVRRGWVRRRSQGRAGPGGGPETEVGMGAPR